VPRKGGARPAATGRGPNGFSFDDECSKNSADYDHKQLDHLHRVDRLHGGLDHFPLVHALVLGGAP
jgi:hypothetical protein